jgi:hypothetical protein
MRRYRDPVLDGEWTDFDWPKEIRKSGRHAFFSPLTKEVVSAPQILSGDGPPSRAAPKHEHVSGRFGEVMADWQKNWIFRAFKCFYRGRST